MLNIITPCSRLGSLPIMNTEIAELYQAIPDLKWWIIVDGNCSPEIGPTIKRKLDHPYVHMEVVAGEGRSGNDQRNRALDLAEPGFVYFLDDDNILHPDFIKYIQSLMDRMVNEGKQGAVWHQDVRQRYVRRIAPDRIKMGMIDTAQYLLTTDIIGDLRWIPDEHCADGFFIEELHRKNPDKFLYIDMVLCYCNEIGRYQG